MIRRVLEGLLLVVVCFHSTNAQGISCGSSPVFINLFQSNLDEYGPVSSSDFIVVSRTPVDNITSVPSNCQRPAVAGAFFSLNLFDCEPYFLMDSTTIRFTWSFRIYYNTSDTVLRVNDTAKNISCAYDRSHNASVSEAVNPLLRQVLVGSVNAQGAFALMLDLFRDSAFGNQLNSGDSIMVTDYIYSRVSIITPLANTTRFVVQIRRCWSTTTNDPLSSPNYALITDSCPANNFTEITRNYEVQNGTFRVNAFVWTTNFSLPIYIHCSVGVCDLADSNADCSQQNLPCPSISGRRKRRDIEDRTLSYGPINIIPYVPASECEQNNGGCSDICSVKNNKIVCSCSFGSTLLTDGKTCSAVEEPYMSETFVNENNPLLVAALVMVVICLLISVAFFLSNRKKSVKKVLDNDI